MVLQNARLLPCFFRSLFGSPTQTLERFVRYCHCSQNAESNYNKSVRLRRKSLHTNCSDEYLRIQLRMQNTPSRLIRYCRQSIPRLPNHTPGKSPLLLQTVRVAASTWYLQKRHWSIPSCTISRVAWKHIGYSREIESGEISVAMDFSLSETNSSNSRFHTLLMWSFFLFLPLLSPLKDKEPCYQ